MIRWYDYVLAVLFADLITGFLLAGFFSTLWWEPIVYGLIAGFIYRSWSDAYCQFRLRREHEND